MQKKFLVCYKQANSGCDYSIDCGTSVSIIYADSLEEAQNKCTNLSPDWKNHCENEDDISDIIYGNSRLRYADPKDDTHCSSITLFEIKDEHDLLPYFKMKLDEINSFKESLVQQEKERKEKEEYLLLKKKYLKLKEKFE